MPWKVFKKVDQHCVYKVDAEGNPVGESLSCHPTPEEAEAQRAALYANDASSSLSMTADPKELFTGSVEIQTPPKAGRDDKDELPSEIKLLPIGEWNGYIDPVKKEKKSFSITPELIHAAVEYHDRRRQMNPDRDLVIDFEHQTLKDVEAPAAGWIDKLIVRADGLYAHVRQWTEKAKQYLKEKAYRYISPVFAFDVPDKVTGEQVPMIILNAALTNEPFFDELKPIVSKTNSQLNFHGGTIMDLQTILTFLAALVGVPADALCAQADTSSAWDAIKGKLEVILSPSEREKNLAASQKEIFTALGLKSEATLEEAKAIIAAKMDLSGYVSKTEYQTLLNQISEREIDEVIAKAFAEGKVAPATKDSMRAWALKDRKSFEEYLGKVAAYSVVPLEKIEVGTIHESPVPDEVLAIAAKIGVTKEMLAKYGSKGNS